MTLMRLPQVVKHTGLPKSTIYFLAARSRFPKPIKLSERISAWRVDDVEKWIEARTTASRPEMAPA
jgi:prophage regulatory protein